MIERVLKLKKYLQKRITRIYCEQESGEEQMECFSLKRAKMCDVFEVAREMCEAGNWEVSNLRLQKMLYIAQVLYKGTYGKHLFRDTFQAWDYGPVCPKVYHEFKMFGIKPVQEWAFPEPKEHKCTKIEKDFIKEMAESMRSITSSRLVGLTHRKGTGWHKNYMPGAKGVVISEDDMLDEYKNVWLKTADEKKESH